MKSAAERRWIIPEERDRLSEKAIAKLFLAQDGLCLLCGQRLEVKGHRPVGFIDEHMKPLWKGGKNDIENRALVCKPCAGDKTSAEATERAKSTQIFRKYAGIKKRKGPPMPGSRDSQYKRTMDGRTIKR
jgi:5-methylcytosine-specific restriction endonuclease McrA